MTEVNNKTPACPVCAGATALKEIHRSTKPDGYMYFFKCGVCTTEYPRFYDAPAAKAAALTPPPRSR